MSTLALPLRRRSGRMPLWIAYAILTPVALVSVLPIVWIVSQSLKPLDELFKYPPDLIVRHPTLRNYQDLLIATSSTAVPFSRYIFNSVFVTVVIVVAGVLISSMAAYPLAKANLPGGGLLFTLIIAALTFPKEVTAIPSYLVISKLHMIDTYWALFLPSLGTAFGLFVMKQFMEQIPTGLLEAARIDGAGELTIFFQLVLPMVKPAVATLAFLAFVQGWNESGPALIYIRSEAMRTLPLAIHTLGQANNIARAGAIAAANMLQFLPLLVAFIISRTRVIQTMAHTGLKG